MMEKNLEKNKYIYIYVYVHIQLNYFANKGPSVVFPVVMYGCENWTIKKAEC